MIIYQLTKVCEFTSGWELIPPWFFKLQSGCLWFVSLSDSLPALHTYYYISDTRQMTSPFSNADTNFDDAFSMLSGDLIPSIPPSLPTKISLDFSGLLEPHPRVGSERRMRRAVVAGGGGARQVSPSLQNDRVAWKNSVCTLRHFSLHPAGGRWETNGKNLK